jgi:hypothetical protein
MGNLLECLFHPRNGDGGFDGTICANVAIATVKLTAATQIYGEAQRFKD